MGSVYRRGNVLWLAYVGADGRRRCVSSGYLAGKEGDARHMLRAIERRVAAELLHETADRGPPTVESFGRRFFGARRAAGIGIAAKELARLQKYILAFRYGAESFGSLKLSDVRPHHVRDFVRHLKGLDVAPRTARAVYFQLRQMFHEALTDELVAANPCVLKKGELPKRVDKNPAWRSGAKFSREESEALISDARIPNLRRVRYAGLVLGALRIGEEAARTWAELDTRSGPLWRLTVSTSFSRQLKRVKSVKTEAPREVPVHPTLARILAAWKLSGWAEAFGRRPGPDDLIWPSATLGHLRDTVVLRELHEDCATLGFRPRRTHDFRRTFISLARGDGASKEILRRVTHGDRGDQMDEYTTLDWVVLCAEVSKLKISLRDGKMISLPVAANVGGNTKMLQSALQPKTKQQQTSDVTAYLATSENGRGGTRTPTGPLQDISSGDNSDGVSRACASGGATRGQRVTPERSNVAAALADARDAWISDGNKRALRRALISLLAGLEGGQ